MEEPEAYRAALADFDRLNERTIQELGAKLDCGAGCAICCRSLRVDVYAHEVFAIAAHIDANFADNERAELLARLAAHAEQVLPLTPFEHATRNLDCPLLRNGRCSVYEVRPQACRRHHSLDVTACQYTFDHPSDLEFPGARDPRLFQVLTRAMQRSAAAYAEAGYDVTVYELGTALEEALTDPESYAGWQSRMEAFVRASITPVA